MPFIPNRPVRLGQDPTSNAAHGEDFLVGKLIRMVSCTLYGTADRATGHASSRRSNDEEAQIYKDKGQGMKKDIAAVCFAMHLARRCFFPRSDE